MKVLIISALLIASASAISYGKWWTPKAIKIDSCTCYEKGNYYQPVSDNDCRSFTQRTAFLPAQTQNCPAGTKFDVNTCVCNHANQVTCPAGCQGHVKPTPTPKVSCQSHGNVYAPVPGTLCGQFTQATAVLPPQTHRCPAGLAFDIGPCVCNFPSDFKCSV